MTPRVTRFGALLLLLIFGLVISLKEISPASAKDKKKQVVFTKDIAPLIFHNCSSCHRAGQVAPFSLLSYEDARKHSKEIVEMTTSRRMPPWKAKHDYVKFSGERRLSDAEIKTIKDWVQSGMEYGDDKDMPAVPKFADSWQLGTPDLILYMPESMTIPPDGPDFFRVFILPVDLPEDKYIKAIDVMPSDRAVVHHTILSLDISGHLREMAKMMRQDMPGFSAPGRYLAGWAPGGLVQPYPEGYARKLPKKSDLILETHFRPTGKVESEQTAVGLYFTDKPNQKETGDYLLFNNNIDLPPNEISHLKIDQVIDSDLTVFGIAGHAHYLCTEIKVHAILPNKKDIPLLWIPDW
ncbi:MAG: cytochrome c, partial [Bacteroidota bacterium]|nr:cytochrome c [Bacteroidota bacterium]